MFSVDTILGILLGESYSGICALVDLSVCVKYINMPTRKYRVIAVHIEWNLIFLVGEDRTLLTYDMNHRKAYALATWVIRYPRPTWSLCINGPHYLPYVPLFIESLT